MAELHINGTDASVNSSFYKSTFINCGTVDFKRQKLIENAAIMKSNIQPKQSLPPILVGSQTYF